MVSQMSRHAHLSIKLRYGYMMGMDVKMRPPFLYPKTILVSVCYSPPPTGLSIGNIWS